MANKGILEVVDILNDYSRDIQEGIEQDGNQVAKNAQSELKNTSPKSNRKRKNKYRTGWRIQKETGFQSCTYTIYNATNYQLTHLLEKPHLTRNGGLTTPKVHIYPVEQKSIKEYEKMVEDTIKNGG